MSGRIRRRIEFLLGLFVVFLACVISYRREASARRETEAGDKLPRPWPKQPQSEAQREQRDDNGSGQLPAFQKRKRRGLSRGLGD